MSPCRMEDSELTATAILPGKAQVLGNALPLCESDGIQSEVPQFVPSCPSIQPIDPVAHPDIFNCQPRRIAAIEHHQS